MNSASSRPHLTVLVPTFNEEDNIRECLESVKWADEILVVDSFSADRTREIASEYTNRVLQHEYVNSAAQKNWSIPQATHPWILIVDADERITPELREEILQTLETGPQFEGYYIRRLNHFMGHPIRHVWKTDKCLRLFLRDKGRYQDRHVHADIILEGKAGYLTHPMEHHTARSFDRYMTKFDRYTTWAAKDRARHTPLVRPQHLLLHPAWRFVKQYILKRGFLDGRAGLIVCGLSAFSAFLKYAKLWEIHQKQKSDKS
ncbi:glycosyltransferase family 2 protein [bacterium]|nr:glycosyltransferase family 2 protein [bacterium]